MTPNVHEERIRYIQKEIETLNGIIDESLFEADEVTLDLCRHKKGRLQKELNVLLDDCKELKGND